MERYGKMIKVLYVSPFSHIGGGEISILTVINNLDKNRFSASLVTYGEGPFAEMARRRGIDTAVIRRSGPLSEISVITNLIAYIRQKDIDIVHVNSLDIRAGVAARLAGVPCVGHLRVIFPLTWRDRLFVRLSRVTIAVSKAAVDYFCEGASGYGKKFIVMPNMVDVPAEVKPAPLRSEFGIPEGAPLIGMAGRMDPFKGHNVFIDAAAIIKNDIPDARFFIVGGPSEGDAAEEEYFKQQKARADSAGMGDSIVFTGFRPDILNVIAALDVLVVPSRVIKKPRGISTEGFGRVAIEAMALGVPVVSSDAGGLKEIVRDGVSGIVVASDDPLAAARAVTGLLGDRERAAAVKSAAKRQFDELYSLKSIEKIEELYRNVIGRGGCRKGRCPVNGR